MKTKATAEMPGIADIKNLNRLLKDTAPVVDRYNRILQAQAEAKATSFAALPGSSQDYKCKRRTGLSGRLPDLCIV